MFFNALWIYGALALLIFGMATRQPSLTVLATLLLLTAGVSWLWNRWSLHGVVYQRRLSSNRVFRDETVTLEMALVNRKLLPLAWIEVEEELPDRVVSLDRRTIGLSTLSRLLLPYLTSLRPYERVAWQATLRCPHRGAFHLGPARLRSGDIFGFFNQAATVEGEERLIVYPRLIPLPDLGIPPRGAFGDTRVRHSLLPDPLRAVGVRDYRPEDSFRWVHWKATARAGQLQVRVFEPTTVTQLGIFLNLDSEPRFWRGLDTPHVEAIVSVAASLAAHAAGQGYAVGAYANRLIAGSNQTLRVPPGNGPGQLAKVLEGLAKLSPFATVDFPKHLRAETLNFPWGSTIVVVTAIQNPALVATLEALRAAGHRLVLVAIDPLPPPPVRGLIYHQVPEAVLAVEARAAADERAPAGDGTDVGQPQPVVARREGSGHGR